MVREPVPISLAVAQPSLIIVVERACRSAGVLCSAPHATSRDRETLREKVMRVEIGDGAPTKWRPLAVTLTGSVQTLETGSVFPLGPNRTDSSGDRHSYLASGE